MTARATFVRQAVLKNIPALRHYNFFAHCIVIIVAGSLIRTKCALRRTKPLP
jgi:hypothetical protein